MIKKIWIIFFGVLMISLGFSVSSYAITGKVTSESLRIRKEASTSAEVITVINKDNEVNIIEKNGEWYKVTYGEYSGYAHGDYISTSGVIEENKTETPVVNTNTNVKVLNATEAIKILPVINSDVIFSLEVNAEVDVLETLNGWSYIFSGKEYGWIRNDKLQDKVVEQTPVENPSVEPNVTQLQTETVDNPETQVTPETTTPVPETPKVETPVEENKTKYVKADALNIRKENNTESEILETLDRNAEVKVTETLDGWCKIKYNNIEGYVNSSYLSDTKAEETTTSRSATYVRTTDANAATSSKGEQIAELAKSFVGNRYVYGGSSPETGFDCSGLVWYVYKQFGYKINRTADAQINTGVEISRENLQPGDILIFLSYSNYSKIGHSGIYIGNDQFVHASTESTGVIITSLSSGSYPARFVCGRRIVD